MPVAEMHVAGRSKETFVSRFIKQEGRIVTNLFDWLDDLVT
jgi:hypothetical protein